MSTVRHGLRATAVVGGVATSVGLLYLLYSNYQKARSGQLDIPREVAIKVLKELRRELYPVFKKILKNVQGVRMTARQNRRNRRGPAGDPMAAFDKIELCEIPDFRELILEVEDRIYAKYNLENKQVFEKFCLALQRTDPEVNAIMTDINDMYVQIKRGDTIRLDFAVPEQITELAALKAQKEIYLTMLTALKENMLSGGAGMESEEEARIAHKRLEESLDAVLRHNGFDVMEDYHSEGVFEQACIKFSRTSPDFKRKLGLLEQNFHNVVNQLLTNRLPLSKVDEEFNRIDRFLELGSPEPVIEEIVPPPVVIEVTSLPQPAQAVEVPPFNPATWEMAENGLLSAPTPVMKPHMIDVIELADAQPPAVFITSPPAGDFPHPQVRLFEHEESPGVVSSALSSTPFEVIAPNQSVEIAFQDITTSHTEDDKSTHT